jgi:hypothetical protein
MNVAAQLLAAEEGIDASPASSRVHAGGGAWVTLHAARLQASTSMPATIAVTVDPITLADRVDVFSRATRINLTRMPEPQRRQRHMVLQLLATR